MAPSENDKADAFGGLESWWLPWSDVARLML